jgi:hypothetical protein
MANKKRTQNKRIKRAGKKQRRRTAAKQRGGEATYEIIIVVSDKLEKQKESYSNEEQWKARIDVFRSFEYDVSKSSQSGNKYSVTVSAPGY